MNDWEIRMMYASVIMHIWIVIFVLADNFMAIIAIVFVVSWLIMMLYALKKDIEGIDKELRR